MKILRRILTLLSILLVTALLSVLVILAVDAYRTSYLKVKNNPQAQNNTYLITHANLIPMTADTVLRNKTVYIREGIIQDIADTITVEGVPVLDANHGYLAPGLMDLHVHVWDRYELGLYLAQGVTAVRNLWGRPEHLRMKREILGGELLGPLFFTSSPKLTGPTFIGDDNLNLTSTEEAREKVIEYQNRGYDFIKTYYGLTDDLFAAIIAQAKLSGLDIAAHPTPEVPYAYHFQAPIVSIEHAEEIIQQPLNYQLDTTKLWEVIEGYAGSPDISFSPTLIVYYNIYRMLLDDDILSSPQLSRMNPLIRKVDSKNQFERWNTTKASDPGIVSAIQQQHDFHLYIIQQLHERGVNIVSSTDAGIGITAPGYALHQELAFYQEAGLSNYEVLKTATVNAAQVHDFLNGLGTIEKGKIANLILLEDNPLQQLAALQRPATVFVEGRKLDRPTLDGFENRALKRQNLLPTGIRYGEYLLRER